jgi:hypothetical protein
MNDAIKILRLEVAKKKVRSKPHTTLINKINFFWWFGHDSRNQSRYQFPTIFLINSKAFSFCEIEFLCHLRRMKKLLNA